jgi:hypothetical protein
MKYSKFPLQRQITFKYVSVQDKSLLILRLKPNLILLKKIVVEIPKTIFQEYPSSGIRIVPWGVTNIHKFKVDFCSCFVTATN